MAISLSSKPNEVASAKAAAFLGCEAPLLSGDGSAIALACAVLSGEAGLAAASKGASQLPSVTSTKSAMEA